MKACPNCGWSSDPPSDRAAGPGRQIAQVASVAEAGYFVALFLEAGVTAEAVPIEAFDAATGAWRLSYAIRVEEDQAEVAAGILRAEASEEFTTVAEKVFDRGDYSGLGATVNPWTMLTVLAVVAAAGAAAVIDSFAGRRIAPAAFGRPQPGRAESLDLLADAVGEAATFRTDAQRGEPRRRLRYLAGAGVWELSTDADRDGRYESHRRFAASVAP